MHEMGMAYVGGTTRKFKITQPPKLFKGLHELFPFWSHMKAHEKCYKLIPISFMVPKLCPNEPAAFCEVYVETAYT
jgi:hypothetical protein